MGVDVAAYVEKKNKETGKWELVTESPVSTRLKYILDDYSELPRIQWGDLSEGMQNKYKKDENGQAYATFYVTTLEDLEREVEKQTTSTFTRINTIVKALGAYRIYRDDGEESAWGGVDDDKSDKLTIPVNKDLIEDLQMAFGDLRKIGQREAFDLLVSEHIHWDGEFRIILSVC